MKKSNSYFRTMLICLLVAFCFVSCGKDKTIEKIIYGDTTNGGSGNNGDTTNGGSGNNGDTLLSKEDFNKIAITRTFETVDDFYNYTKQCYIDKTNLTGKKFKVKGHFDLEDCLNYNNGSDKYSYKIINFYTSTSIKPYLYLYINWINTDLNTDKTSVEEIIFIVNTSYYYYDTQYFHIRGYSYDLATI